MKYILIIWIVSFNGEATIPLKVNEYASQDSCHKAGEMFRTQSSQQSTRQFYIKGGFSCLPRGEI